MITASERIKALTVETECRGEAGTGIIYWGQPDDPYCYIITARHCIYGKNNDNKAVVTDINIRTYHDTEMHPLTTEDSMILPSDKDDDILALRIRKKSQQLRSVGVYYLLPLIIEDMDIPCSFYGYPNFSEGRGVFFTAHVDARETQGNIFQLASKDDFTHDMQTLPKDNLKGLSGSGVYVEINNEIYLLGVVSEYQPANHKFNCRKFSTLIGSCIPETGLFSYDVEKLVSDVWFEKTLENTSKKMGPRFTTEHYPVTLEDELGVLCRDGAFLAKIRDIGESMLRDGKDFDMEMESLDTKVLHKYLIVTENGEEKKKAFKTLLKEFQTSHGRLVELVMDSFLQSKKSDYGGILDAADGCMTTLNGISYAFSRYQDQFPSWAALLRNALNRLKTHNSSLSKFPLWDAKYMMIYGRAGNGKSQLLAYMANRLNKEGHPSILIPGQRLLKLSDPELQILAELQLGCDWASFLKALNKKGAINRKRVIIFIDALNEGRGLSIWNQNLIRFIESFHAHEWIRLVFSYRTSFRSALFKGIQLEEQLHFEHTGFNGRSVEAMRYFFSTYNITAKEPLKPTREFENPLFLKSFCITRENGIFTNDMVSIDGMQKVIDDFLEYVNDILGNRDRFDYRASSLNLVRKVVYHLITGLIQSGNTSLKYESAFLDTEQIVSPFLNRKGFLNGLLDEDVFYENGAEDEASIETVLDFAYEKFGDYLKAAYLLENMELGDLRAAFLPGGKIHNHFVPAELARKNEGLLEALNAHINRKFRLTMADYASEMLKDQRSLATYIRELDSIQVKELSAGTDRYIKEQAIASREIRELLFDSILNVAGIPDHYFNGNYLNRWLMPLSMAERDIIWTSYLQDKEYQRSGAVAVFFGRLDINTSIMLQPDSVLSICRVLCWFLCSANRPLRDRATGILITVLHKKMDLLKSIYQEFRNADDRYLVQRLHAIVFGCVIRTDDRDMTASVCEDVYRHVFQKDEVYPDILLRDYARNTIEFALSVGITPVINPEKTRPPYKSRSLPRPYTINEINMLSAENGDGSRSLLNLLASMTTDSNPQGRMYGDFGRYVFGSALKYWKNIDEDEYSRRAIRLIIEKYGYKAEAHGVLDDNLDTLLGYRGRSPAEIERIGKKYQWAAFHEILAYLSDNAEYNGERGISVSGDSRKSYHGPWSPNVRDFDPTEALEYADRNTPALQTPPHYGIVSSHDSADKWLSDYKDLPDPKNFVLHMDQSNAEWLALENGVSWSGAMNDSSGNLFEMQLWYQIRSYICDMKDLDRTVSWARKQNLMGRWMPEGRNIYNIYSRELYWAPACMDFDTTRVSLHDPNSGARITEVSPAAITYNWEKNVGNDGAAHFLKPCRDIHRIMGLRYGDCPGDLFNSKGELVCFNPVTNSSKSEPALMIRRKDLMAALKKENLAIFWTCLGEKSVYPKMRPMQVPVPHRQEISSIIWEDEKKLHGSLLVERHGNPRTIIAKKPLPLVQHDW